MACLQPEIVQHAICTNDKKRVRNPTPTKVKMLGFIALRGSGWLKASVETPVMQASSGMETPLRRAASSPTVMRRHQTLPAYLSKEKKERAGVGVGASFISKQIVFQCTIKMEKLFKEKKRFALEQVRSHQRRSIISQARSSTFLELLERLLVLPVQLPVLSERFNQLIKSIEGVLDQQPQRGLQLITGKGLDRMLTVAKVNELDTETLTSTCRCVKRLLNQRHYWSLQQLQTYLQLLSKLLRINGQQFLQSFSCLLRGLFLEDLNQMQLISSQQSIIRWALTNSNLVPVITPFVLNKNLSQQTLKILVNLTYLHPRFSDKIFKSDLLSLTRQLIGRGNKEQIALYIVLMSNIGMDGADLVSAREQLLIPLLNEPQLLQGPILQQLLILLAVVTSHYSGQQLCLLSEQLRMIDFFIRVLQLPFLQVCHLPFIENSLGPLLQNFQLCEQFRAKGGRRLLEELWQNGGQQQTRRMLEQASRDS